MDLLKETLGFFGCAVAVTETETDRLRGFWGPVLAGASRTLLKDQ